jgi:hypothetical protein
MALNNRIKELIQQNKFKHRLGLGGYKATIPIWTKKEHELREAGIPDPLVGCMLRMRKWIWGQSGIVDNGQMEEKTFSILQTLIYMLILSSCTLSFMSKCSTSL